MSDAAEAAPPQNAKQDAALRQLLASMRCRQYRKARFACTSALAAGADFRTLRCADRQQVAALFRDVLQAAGEKRRLVRGPAPDDSTLRSARAREVLGYGLGFLVLVGVILKN